MQQQQRRTRPTSGAKAQAIDGSKLLKHYRLLQLLAVVGSAAMAIILRIFFGH